MDTINVIVYTSQGPFRAELTTDHARSSYGVPVLRLPSATRARLMEEIGLSSEVTALGPNDPLPGAPESGPQLAREAVIVRADSIIPEFDPMSTDEIDCSADVAAEREFQTALRAFRGGEPRIAV